MEAVGGAGGGGGGGGGGAADLDGVALVGVCGEVGPRERDVVGESCAVAVDVEAVWMKGKSDVESVCVLL